MKNYIDDILLVLGAGIIIATTAALSITAGLYTLGAALIAGAIIMAITTKRGDKR